MIYFLIDEYENFDEQQQRSFNTLIKHAAEWYTFKVGVREMGWRTRQTTGKDEQLVSPADYVKVDIAARLHDRFSEFAAGVCNLRLKVMPEFREATVQALLPARSIAEEAQILGVTKAIRNACDDLKSDHSEISGFALPEQWMIVWWAKGHNQSVADVLNFRRSHPRKWKDRLENYSYASLFSIRSGLRGARKLYCGHEVLATLAGCNIRYYMEIIETCFRKHYESEGSLGGIVDPEVQTIAAQAVGEKYVFELDGLSAYGANLTRLVLGLGRVFQVMASQPAGHAPEVNQFELGHVLADTKEESEVRQLLTAAVMHLALIRFSGNKLQDQGDIREYHYSLHPIFAAFFEFSHRLKRHITIAPSEILALVHEPRAAIPRLLSKQGRSLDDELPVQLGLFEDYYGESK